MLIIQESPEVSRTIVGDPIWLPALRYVSGSDIIFEFSNKRVYRENTDEFSPALQVLVDQLLNELKKYEGTPFTVTIFDKDLEEGQRRAQLWRRTLESNLLRPAADFNVKVSLPAERGDITQVTLEVTK
jgi:hypothetical protein